MIDPRKRWGEVGGKPGYAGLVTFAGVPYTESASDLADIDVAIVGAPFDDLVSERPGGRFAPRAIRCAGCQPGASLACQVDGLAELRVVDFGDAPCVPADPERSHAAIGQTVGEVVNAGAIPLVLGGDHSIVEPDVKACARRHGAVGLLHLDTHADTGVHVFGARRSHGTAMRRLVESGAIESTRYVQLGLRGYWPGPEEFEWQSTLGISSYYMTDMRERGIEAVLHDAIRLLGGGPVFLSVDMDVVDPAFAPGVGDPQPGGLSSGELLLMCRRFAQTLTLVGADIVEVIPTWIGQADQTAVVAERAAREIITGLALKRRAQA